MIKVIKNNNKKNNLEYYLNSIKTKKKIILIHENRIGYETTKAHKLAEKIDKSSNIEVIYDKKVWKTGEITSNTETNNRERQMVKDADFALRLIPPSSKIGEKRHLGGRRETNKVINQQVPLLEVYTQNAHDSPKRSLREKNYHSRETTRQKPYQNLDDIVLQGFKKLDKKGLGLKLDHNKKKNSSH